MKKIQALLTGAVLVSLSLPITAQTAAQMEAEAEGEIGVEESNPGVEEPNPGVENPNPRVDPLSPNPDEQENQLPPIENTTLPVVTDDVDDTGALQREVESLREQVRMLTEANEVLQIQVREMEAAKNSRGTQTPTNDEANTSATETEAE